MSNDANNCDSVTVQTKDIEAVVYTRCVGDAPLIGFVLSKTDNLREPAGRLLLAAVSAEPGR